jgi:hypothetical protein
VTPRTSRRTAARTERRANVSLREVLDELLDHARMVARRARHMSAAELDQAQQRLEWLADEVWRVATGGQDPR